MLGKELLHVEVVGWSKPVTSAGLFLLRDGVGHLLKVGNIRALERVRDLNKVAFTLRSILGIRALVRCRANHLGDAAGIVHRRVDVHVLVAEHHFQSVKEVLYQIVYSRAVGHLNLVQQMDAVAGHRNHWGVEALIPQEVMNSLCHRPSVGHLLIRCVGVAWPLRVEVHQNKVTANDVLVACRRRVLDKAVVLDTSVAGITHRIQRVVDAVADVGEWP